MRIPDQDHWARLWHAVGGLTDPFFVYQGLMALYSQPQRHYHTVTHLAECLHQFDLARDLATQPVALELAIWYHDAIYNPRAQDNEEQSAALAKRNLIGGGVNSGLIQSVTALVLATKAHDASLHLDAGLMVDIDLSIFGQAAARFEEYEAQIRREYSWVHEELFRAERARILEQFLARPRIYHTEVFFAKYEEAAQANLRSSLKKLRGEEHA